MWVNHFVNLEHKKQEDNRFILGFYSGEKGSVTLFLKHDLVFPSGRLDNESEIERILGLLEDRGFSRFPISARVRREESISNRFGYVQVEEGRVPSVQIKMPYNNSLVKHLPAEFHREEYEKLARMAIPPEQIVFLSLGMENIFDFMQANSKRADEGMFVRQLREINPDNEVKINGRRLEVTLADTTGITYTGRYIGEDFLRHAPKEYGDIEKVLFKTDKELELLSERKEILKAIRRSPQQQAVLEQRMHEIETALIIRHPTLGDVSLADGRLKEEVSHINVIFENESTVQNRIYVLDKREDLRKTESKGYLVVPCTSEAGEISALHADERKNQPAIEVYHNSGYDRPNLRQSAKDSKDDYDLFIDGVQPRLDVSKGMFRRSKQDRIILDTLWLAKLFFPHLGRTRFHGGYSLGALAPYLGIPFVKGESYDSLRNYGITVALSESLEERVRDQWKQINYAVDDGPVLQKVLEEINPYRLLGLMKEALYYLNTTKTAAHSHAAMDLLEHRHWEKFGTLPYTSFTHFLRMKQLEVFTEGFKKMQSRWMSDAGIYARGIGGYEGPVKEIYVPLEEWIAPQMFKFAPELRKPYDITADNQQDRIALLQYMRALMMPLLRDHYVTTHNRDIFKDVRDCLFSSQIDYVRASSHVLTAIEANNPDLIQNLGKKLTALHRDVLLIDEKSKKDKNLRVAKNDREYRRLNIPRWFWHERRLARLTDIIDSNPAYQTDPLLRKFSITFRQFTELLSETQAYTNVPNSPGVVYAVLREERARKRINYLDNVYSITSNELEKTILEGYRELGDDLHLTNARVFAVEPPYIYVASDSDIPHTYTVHTFPEVPKALYKKEEDEVEEQMLLIS